MVANNKERKGKWLWTDADEGDMLSIYTAHDAENEALFIADTTDKILRQYPDRRVAVLTAPIRSRARSKKRCGATTGSTTSSAGSVTTSAPK